MNRNIRDGRGYRPNDSFNQNKTKETRFNLNRRNDHNLTDNRNNNNRNYNNRNDSNRNNSNRNNYNRNSNHWNDNNRNNFNNRRLYRGPNRGDDNDYYNEDRRRNNDNRNNFQRKFFTSNRSVKMQRSGSVPSIMHCSDLPNNSEYQSEDSYNQNMTNNSRKRKRDFSPQRRSRSLINWDSRPQSKPNKKNKRMDEKKQNSETYDDEGDCGTWPPWLDVEENNENSDKESNELSAASDIEPEEEEEAEEVQVESLIDQTNLTSEEISLNNDLRCQAMMKLTVYHCIACHCINIAREDAMKHVKTEYHKVAFKNLLKKMTGIDIVNHQDLAQACKIVNFDENLNLPGSSHKKRNHFHNLLADSFKSLSRP